MAQISSFRGYRFNPGEAGDINKIVTQPYDQIDDELRDGYYDRSEYNVVRIIKGKTKQDDTPNDNQYTRAAKYWEDWIEERVLIREGGPAIYPYHQEYIVEGETCLRKGLIVLVDLSDENSAVRAHETTLSGPKADRLKLMRATEANDGQIFMLYQDRENEINNLLDQELSGASPIIEVQDDIGATHRLYRIVRPGLITDVNEIFAKFDLFIADGHHRYETAINYMNECTQRNWTPVGTETFTHRMMTLVNMYDPGLTVLPTHRLIHSLDSFDASGFLSQAEANFDVVPFGDKNSLYMALDTAGKEGKSAFGFAADGLNDYRLLTLKDPTVIESMVEGEHSDSWKRLDVTVLHVALLENLMGIDSEKLAAETNIRYVRGRDSALNMVGDGYQAAFILNPTRVDQVSEVATAGERMPQKSTDFFPKLLTGMVMMKMTLDKSMGLAVYLADD